MCSTGSSCGQPVPTSTKWVLTLIFCIIVIRNGLNTKHSSHFWLNFMFLVQLLISFWLVMTCVIPSQMAYSFIISNASHSMHCSSVEACLLWKCCYQSVLINHELHGIFYLWYYLWQEICAINAQSGYSNKRAVLVIISMQSLVSIEQQSPRRPVTLNPMHNLFRREKCTRKASTLNLLAQWGIFLTRFLMDNHYKTRNQSEVNASSCSVLRHTKVFQKWNWLVRK